MADQSKLDNDLKQIKNTLMKEKQFAAAKDELLKLRTASPHHAKLAQQLAVCTYKNVEQAPAERYAEALNVLESVGFGSEQCDPETLRLGGAIYKRKWHFDGRLENLYHAYSLYREAADNDADDLGYGAVNAAFILDLLSARARVRANKTGTSREVADKLALDARELREKTIGQLDEALSAKPVLADDTWFAPTYAEAHFGLGTYDEKHYDIACEYLGKAVKKGLDDWESETSFRQLVAIAKAQGVELPCRVEDEDEDENKWHPAWKALRAYLGNNTRAALECYRGRVGLALSGGGFRASFYHIGVLARLAEMDVLRSVEVISSVSGGSILGAHYYLEVQRLLKTKSDVEIKKQDYIDIVNRVKEQFFAGVSKNLRMRTFANPLANIGMLFSHKYSRSHRIGMLYERDLYSNIGKDEVNKACEIQSRNMSDLLISPEGTSASRDFNPNRDNWLRSSRAPVLLLNTTSLNSGHNWRFTARWMGEPPGTLGNKIDKNSRYPWVDYGEHNAPQVRLGHAVAASACVPGLFEPLEIADLYKKSTVKLVDGGVHDNQGIAGLLDEGCTLILCSDASGQMDSELNPGTTIPGVPLRSNSILMDRVREIEYQDLVARVESRALDGLFFTHLKSGLKIEKVAFKTGSGDLSSGKQSKTEYGIHPVIQKKIAALRTDLDCFSEVEANALMLSGYKMTEWQFSELQRQHEESGEAGSWGDFAINAESEFDSWSFLDSDFVQIAKVDPESGDPAAENLAKQLDIGASLFLKVFKAVPLLKYTGLMLLLVIAITSLYCIWQNWELSVFQITVGGIATIVLFALLAFLWPVFKWLNPKSVIENKLLLFILGLLGSMVSLVQVYILDGFYLRSGKLQKLKDLQKK